MKPRTAAIIIPILALILAWLWQLASAGRQRRLTLVALNEAQAYQLGYSQGLSGVPGYWPEYARTEYNDVPGVGRVWRASPAESAYWRGWHEGEDARDHTIH